MPRGAFICVFAPGRISRCLPVSCDAWMIVDSMASLSDYLALRGYKVHFLSMEMLQTTSLRFLTQSQSIIGDGSISSRAGFQGRHRTLSYNHKLIPCNQSVVCATQMSGTYNTLIARGDIISYNTYYVLRCRSDRRITRGQKYPSMYIWLFWWLMPPERVDLCDFPLSFSSCDCNIRPYEIRPPFGFPMDRW